MKKNIFNTVVPLSFNDYRIDKFLHFKIVELSRTRIQALIHDEQVKLNNHIVSDPAKKIKNKDRILENFILGGYTFCFYERFREKKFHSQLKFTKGLQYFLEGHSSQQVLFCHNQSVARKRFSIHFLFQN